MSNSKMYHNKMSNSIIFAQQDHICDIIIISILNEFLLVMAWQERNLVEIKLKCNKEM